MDTSATKPMSVLFYRIFWTLGGPFALMLVAASIVQAGDGWFTGKDLLFGALLLITILCRWGDFRKGDPRDSYGEPVTAQDMQRYTFTAVIAGGTLWAVANLVGNYLL